MYVFLPLCLILYYVSKNPRYRNVVLVAFSLIFYAWGETRWIFILLLISLSDWLLGKAVSKYRGSRKASVALGCALVLDIAILMFFKFSDKVLGFANNSFGLSVDTAKFMLPVGLSFFVFKSISYMLDVYWGKVEAEKNYGRYLMYISLFTQIVAGPIIRYADVADELAVRNISINDIDEGINRIVVGLVKKVVIADNLIGIANTFLGKDASFTVLGTWYGVIIYTLQVYYDFDGYSDIAIGISRLFGFHIKENFNYPFICKTIAEFWQRWHISLGSFFRDYLLYVPIFGAPRKYAGLFLVWFCTGLWHGAHWNYIIWGLYFGLFIFIETLLGKKRIKKIPHFILHIYTKLVLIIGFGIFYYEDFGLLGKFFRAIVGLEGKGLANDVLWSSISNNIFLILAAVLFSMPVIPMLRKRASESKILAPIYGVANIVFNVAGLAICSILLVNSTNHPFLYANF